MTMETRNIDSHICWSLVSLETQKISREESTRKNLSKRLELRLSLNMSIKTMLCQLDLLSTTLTSKILKKITLRLLKLEPLLEKKSERDLLKLTETYPAPKPMTKPTTSDTSLTDLDSEYLYVYLIPCFHCFSS